MKNIAAVLTISSMLLFVTACAPRLSTTETCVELRAITSGYDEDTTKEEKQKMADDVRDLAGRASETLKDEIADAAEAESERLKDEPDQEKLDELMDRMAANNRVDEACYN